MGNDGASFRVLCWDPINGKVSEAESLMHFAEENGFAPAKPWPGQLFRGIDRDGNRLGIFRDGRFTLTGRTARAVTHLIDEHAKGRYEA